MAAGTKVFLSIFETFCSPPRGQQLTARVEEWDSLWKGGDYRNSSEGYSSPYNNHWLFLIPNFKERSSRKTLDLTLINKAALKNISKNNFIYCYKWSVGGQKNITGYKLITFGYKIINLWPQNNKVWSQDHNALNKIKMITCPCLIKGHDFTMLSPRIINLCTRAFFL